MPVFHELCNISGGLDFLKARCGHICNASYAVRADLRGHHIGETLVKHCMAKG